MKVLGVGQDAQHKRLALHSINSFLAMTISPFQLFT